MPLPKISTPTYELEIPSTKKKIRYRPFLVKEEKILIIAMESQSDTEIANAVKDVLSTCILTKGVKVDALSTFDRYSAGKYSSYDRYRGAYNNIRDENAMRRIETKAIADDSGLSQKEAAIIQAGGFVETVIE